MKQHTDTIDAQLASAVAQEMSVGLLHVPDIKETLHKNNHRILS